MLLGVYLLAGIAGSTQAREDVAILERYRTSESYGSVAFASEDDPMSVSLQISLEKYARSRGIVVVDESDETADSLIRIDTDGNDGSHIATRFTHAQELDQIHFVPSRADAAQLIVDELLLMWHPPNSNSARRDGVMDYALKPFYRPRRSFSGLVLLPNAQAWHSLDSTKPTFTWEPFPRPLDISPDGRASDFQEVRYQFRLVSFTKGGKTAFEVSDLLEPSVAITDDLGYCHRYRWSVRAVFRLNGVPRQTEWTSFLGRLGRPWNLRRRLRGGVFLSADSWPDGNFLGFALAVITPPNPFAEACTDEQGWPPETAQ